MGRPFLSHCGVDIAVWQRFVNPLKVKKLSFLSDYSLFQATSSVNAR